MRRHNAAMSKHIPHIAALSFALSPAGDGAMQIFPVGQFSAPRGALRGKGPWRLDAESAARLIAAVANRANAINIDYEHQTLLAKENGQPAPAAGWIAPDALEWRDDGLYARQPEWTARAAAYIDAGEYRYVSPLFTYDAQTGEVLDLINVALTNNPAIDGMQALTLAAASALTQSPLTHPTENPMEKLLQLLGLAADADVAAACTAVEALQAKLSEGQTQIAALSAQTAQAATVDPAKYVPVAAYNDAMAKLAALSGETLEAKIAGLVEDGIKTGKIIGEAAKQWATELGKKDIAALSAFLDKQPGIAALSGMQTSRQSHESRSAALSPEQAEVARNLGISEDDYRKHLEA